MAPFRAEHMGSLLRPPALTAQRLRLDGQNSLAIAADPTLNALEDAAIKDIVQRQMAWGFRGLTDGEFRRHQFWGTFFPGLQGFEEIDLPDWSMFRTYVPDIGAFSNPHKYPNLTKSAESGHRPGESLVCIGKIKHTGSQYLREWSFLKSLVPPDRVCDLKLTLPAPEWYHLRYKPGAAYSSAIYANDGEYFADIAAAYRTELAALYDAGVRNVTIDDPNLAYFCSEAMLDGFKAAGEDAQALFEAYIKLYNDCLSERPADMHVGLHLCRGNFSYSRHFSSGGYERVAERLFREVSVDTFFLEYDTERAGGFEPLVHVPAGKNVVLGVVSSKHGRLEDVCELKARVHKAAGFMAKGAGQTVEQALQRMGVSPQCGFASHHLGNAVTEADMEAKMKLVRQLANEIWPGED
ncbi:hypothetical protein TD95_000279 [Thielaviopsis punctulata]|uniref:Cobalamin-independent methionine synthase MetE C-terminal/archaeal domain-containing protein n=1 Tax=Thielaviopsis punctulata TaxID=72032 RepID=A0A0F4ZF84_9PEZI|nr:hypothetical protein TD95_000279 [Thielaviopsis punctulata]